MTRERKHSQMHLKPIDTSRHSPLDELVICPTVWGGRAGYLDPDPVEALDATNECPRCGQLPSRCRCHGTPQK